MARILFRFDIHFYYFYYALGEDGCVTWPRRSGPTKQSTPTPKVGLGCLDLSSVSKQRSRLTSTGLWEKMVNMGSSKSKSPFALSLTQFRPSAVVA